MPTKHVCAFAKQINELPDIGGEADETGNVEAIFADVFQVFAFYVAGSQFALNKVWIDFCQHKEVLAV